MSESRKRGESDGARDVAEPWKDDCRRANGGFESEGGVFEKGLAGGESCFDVGEAGTGNDAEEVEAEGEGDCMGRSLLGL